VDLLHDVLLGAMRYLMEGPRAPCEWERLETRGESHPRRSEPRAVTGAAKDYVAPTSDSTSRRGG